MTPTPGLVRAACALAWRLVAIGVVLASQTLFFYGCRRDSQGQAERVPAPVRATPEHVDSSMRKTGCAAQAARVAAHDWGHGRTVSWQAHYSPKYDHCYALVDYQIDIANDAGAVVSELWDAFEARVLAECTNDRRPSIQHGLCQVTEDDDPFTSCAVCTYFIAEHMAH